MKTTGGNSDYDIRMGVTGGSSTGTGQGALSFYCGSCAIGSDLNVSGTLTCGTMLISTTSFSNIQLNSQNIYSTILSSSYTGNGSNATQKVLPNNGLAEVYLIDSTGSMYLPQTPSAGTKLTFRRIFVGTTVCNIYSYNASANVIIVNGQTSATNLLSIASSTGVISATLVYYNGLWYQI